jgi:hypothetical protein
MMMEIRNERMSFHKKSLYGKKEEKQPKIPNFYMRNSFALNFSIQL